MWQPPALVNRSKTLVGPAQRPHLLCPQCLAIVRALLTVSSWMKHHCTNPLTLMWCRWAPDPWSGFGDKRPGSLGSAISLVLVCIIFILYKT